MGLYSGLCGIDAGNLRAGGVYYLSALVPKGKGKCTERPVLYAHKRTSCDFKSNYDFGYSLTGYLCPYSNRRQTGAGHNGRIFYRLLFSGYHPEPYEGKGAGTATNIGVNFVIAFLIFFFIFNGYTYFSSSDEEDYYEKYYEEKGFHWQGQEYPLTLQELAGPEFDGKGYIDTRNLQSSVFLSRMEIEQFYDEALSGAREIRDIIWNMW